MVRWRTWGASPGGIQSRLEAGTPRIRSPSISHQSFYRKLLRGLLPVSENDQQESARELLTPVHARVPVFGLQINRGDFDSIIDLERRVFGCRYFDSSDLGRHRAFYVR